jgi:porin
MVGRSARRAAAAAGEPLRPRETGWELTYADRLAPWLTVQPDVQYIRRAGKAADPRDALVFTLRLTMGWSRD